MDANFFIDILASFAMPPVVESATGVNVACSTSLILSSYARFLACSCYTPFACLNVCWKGHRG